MALYGWHNCPVAARAQIDRLASTFSSLLSEHLIGIYFHGSLAMGCFNPHHSDLDLLVITTHRLPLTTKRQLIEYLLRCSQQPYPIEISLLAQSQLLPWRYPPAFDLHYSEMWRDTYARDLLSGRWQAWNATDHHDPDLAAHITMLNARGFCLTGKPIATIFPRVPADDYHASLAGDLHDSIEAIETDPVYTILNCCRTYAYVREGHLLSKEEGGWWALGVLPAEECPVVRVALEAYCSDTGEQRFEPNGLRVFAAAMRERLAPVLQRRAAN